MAISKTRGKRYTKRRGFRKRRGTKRHHRRQSRRQSRRQYGGLVGMTTSVTFDNPNEMNEEEYVLARQLRIFD